MYGPASYARAFITGAQVEPFAIEVSGDGTKGYYSVLYVKADSPYKTVQDLRGKNLCLVDPNSTSGNNVPRYALHNMGIEPEKFFSRVVYTGSHENAVIALNQGTVDMAANWWNDEQESNLLRMARKGMVKSEDFRIVFRSEQIVNSPFASAARRGRRRGWSSGSAGGGSAPRRRPPPTAKRRPPPPRGRTRR
jgi:phosphonate transport system substrate-binding protein